MVSISLKKGNGRLLRRAADKQIKGRIYLKMDIHSAARAGDLSALQDAIKRGDDVNSVNEVSWFVGM